jgi:EmrB/QacA subfamily drug resistance transporter
LTELHPYRWLALFGISLLSFTAFLDITIVNTALPFIQKAFQAPVLELQWVSNAFSLVMCTAMVAAGNFADRFGRKKLFFIGTIFFVLASWGAGASGSMAILILFRALQGLGVSLLYTSSTAMLSDLFSTEEHAKAISLYTAVTGIGLMSGPAIGGMLVGLLSWKWVFWVNVPMVVAGLICSFIGLRGVKSRSPTTDVLRVDWIGLILFTVGLGGFIYGLIVGASEGWTQPKTAFPLIVGILSLSLLVWYEKKIPNPLINFSIFKNRIILLAAFGCIAAGLVSRVYIFFDPLYLETVRNLSPFAIGFLVAMLPAGQVVVSCFFAKALKKIDLGYVLVFSILTAFVSGWIHFFIGAQFPLSLLWIPYVLLGFTWGLSAALLVTSIKTAIPNEKAGSAIGTLASLWNVLGIVFLALSSVVFHFEEKKTGEFMPAFKSAMGLNALFLTIVFAAALYILISDRGKTQKQPS